MSEANKAAAASNEIKFKDDLLEMAEKVKASITVDNESGVLSLPASAFFDLAPEAVTEESYEAVRKHQDLFTNAVTKAATELSVEAFKKTKTLEQTTLSAPVWKKDSFEGVFKRHGTVRNVSTGEVTAFVGAVGAARFNPVSTRTLAEAKAIKQHMRQMAEAAGL